MEAFLFCFFFPCEMMCSYHGSVHTHSHLCERSYTTHTFADVHVGMYRHTQKHTPLALVSDHLPCLVCENVCTTALGLKLLVTFCFSLNIISQPSSHYTRYMSRIYSHTVPRIPNLPQVCILLCTSRGSRMWQEECSL
jgi:hypothetical protein